MKLWDTASGELRETIVPGESGYEAGKRAVSTGEFSAGKRTMISPRSFAFAASDTCKISKVGLIF